MLAFWRRRRHRTPSASSAWKDELWSTQLMIFSAADSNCDGLSQTTTPGDHTA